MARKRADILVLWPEYFDSNLTRSQGRRVSKENSVSDPSCENIFKVSRKLGLYPEIENERNHPSTWHKKNGRVIIRKKGRKTEILQAIGNNLNKIK